MTGSIPVRAWYCGATLSVAGFICALAWCSSLPIYAHQQTGATAPSTAGAAPRADAPLSFPAVGNLNQLMRGILFPSSNIIFDVQTQDPGAQKLVTSDAASTVTARYGNLYEPWVLVEIAAISLAESAPLLLTPDRRCENGRPVPVDRADWRQYVQGLVEAGRAAYKAAQTRNHEAVVEVTTVVADACASCHRVYRDRRAAAMRCMPS